MSSKSTATTSNAVLLHHYQSLPQPSGKCLVTYVWNDGLIETTRTKTRVFPFVPKDVTEVPIMAFGCLDKDEAGNVICVDDVLKPQAMYRDPFRLSDKKDPEANVNKLVLCDIWNSKGKPRPGQNTRAALAESVSKVQEKHDPWFGVEQEYVMTESILGTDSTGSRILGWPVHGAPVNQRYDFMYGTGPDLVIGRPIHEAFLSAALYAGIDIYGENSEAMPGQWEFQIGPLPGTKCGDDLWMARHILYRVAEEFNVSVTLDPKVVEHSGYPGTGAHTNYSTKQTRDKAIGFQTIKDMMEKLTVKQEEHMKVYDRKAGADNQRRLLGDYFNSATTKFSWGVSDRSASVRIPEAVAKEGGGYFEDRRPAGNADPFLVMDRIIKTTLLDE